MFAFFRQNKLFAFSRLFSRINFLLLLVFVSIFTACQKSEKKSDTFEIFSVNEDKAAGSLVNEANEKLKDIKKIYFESKPKIEELQAAMKSKDTEKVRQITKDFIDSIDNGVALGEDAYDKIDKASNMKINEKFQDYLNLKKTSLRKQLDAFKFRRENAVLLREAFGKKDDKLIEKAKADFVLKEDNFRQLIVEAKRISLQANALAVQSTS